MDTAIFFAINGLAGRSEWLDVWMAFWAHPSPGLIGLGLLLAGWVWWNWWEALLALPTIASAVAIADAIGAQAKHVVQRPRPCAALPDVTVFGHCGGQFSFPSNHAANSATIAAFLQVLYPRSGWVTWPIVVLIGLGRVFIGAHYVTDVLGGWLLGIVMGAGAAALLLRWHRFRPVARRDVPTARAERSPLPLAE